MLLRVGQTLRSQTDPTTVIVVRAPADEVDLTCGGVAMVDDNAVPVTSEAVDAFREGTLLGKRYEAVGGSFELLCTKGGTSSLAVDATVLQVKSAKPLPASD